MTDVTQTDGDGGSRRPTAAPTPPAAGTPGSGAHAFVDALTAAAGKLPALPDADPKVTAAIQLGWLAEDVVADQTIDQLDGQPIDARQGRMAQSLRLAQLAKTLDLTSPEIATTAQRLAGNDGEGAARCVSEWQDVLPPLLGDDSRLARAYLLGRSLNRLRNRPYAKGLFEEPEVTTIVERLDQLTSVLPPHAGRGVANAVRRWREYEVEPDLDGKDPPDPKNVLKAQCDLWYRILTGQKRAVELLEPTNYADAGKRMATRLGREVWNVIGPIWPFVLAVLALLGGGVAAVAATATGTGGSVAGITAILTAFGLTWKGVGGTLGKLASNLEGPFWNAEIDGAVTDAVLLLPQKPRQLSLRERRREAPGGDYAGRGPRAEAEAEALRRAREAAAGAAAALGPAPLGPGPSS
jgi:hypothetical protein